MHVSLYAVPSQNTNVYHMAVQHSQMFANIKHSITVFNEHLFDVCEDSFKCEKGLCLTGLSAKFEIVYSISNYPRMTNTPEASS